MTVWMRRGGTSNGTFTVMDTQCAHLARGTRLFTCSTYCAACVSRTVVEVQGWEAVHRGDGPLQACSHCAWCGSLIDRPPVFCFFHAHDCPEIDPAQMVAITLAARRYRAVFGAAPAAREVNRWISQASKGITDTGTFLGF